MAKQQTGGSAKGEQSKADKSDTKDLEAVEKDLQAKEQALADREAELEARKSAAWEQLDQRAKELEARKSAAREQLDQRAKELEERARELEMAEQALLEQQAEAASAPSPALPSSSGPVEYDWDKARREWEEMHGKDKEFDPAAWLKERGLPAPTRKYRVVSIGKDAPPPYECYAVDESAAIAALVAAHKVVGKRPHSFKFRVTLAA